jgi:hypothetical protein
VSWHSWCAAIPALGRVRWEEIKCYKAKKKEGAVTFLFAVLGFELRAYTLSYSTSPFFVMGFFEIGSQELLAWAGFEP